LLLLLVNSNHDLSTFFQMAYTVRLYDCGKPITRRRPWFFRHLCLRPLPPPPPPSPASTSSSKEHLSHSLSSTSTRSKTSHLGNAGISIMKVPCCEILHLLFEHTETKNTKMLSGNVYVRLLDHTNFAGDNVFVGHHDTHHKGLFPVFPRGAQISGLDMANTLVMFKPWERPWNAVDAADAAAKVVIDPIHRIYALHVEGHLGGEPFHSTNFVQFHHTPEGATHLPPSALWDQPFACHFTAKLGSDHIYIQEAYWPRASYNFNQGLEVPRHHLLGGGMTLRGGKVLGEQNVLSRLAFIRDLDTRSNRTNLFPLDDVEVVDY
jgi:hypothetical protein